MYAVNKDQLDVHKKYHFSKILYNSLCADSCGQAACLRRQGFKVQYLVKGHFDMWQKVTEQPWGL